MIVLFDQRNKVVNIWHVLSHQEWRVTHLWIDVVVDNVSKLWSKPVVVHWRSESVVFTNEETDWHLCDVVDRNDLGTVSEGIWPESLECSTEGVAVTPFNECTLLHDMTVVHHFFGRDVIWEVSHCNLCCLEVIPFFMCLNLMNEPVLEPIELWSKIVCNSHSLVHFVCWEYIPDTCEISKLFSDFTFCECSTWKMCNTSFLCNDRDWSQSSKEVNLFQQLGLIVSQCIEHLCCSLWMSNICDLVISRKLSYFVDLSRNIMDTKLSKTEIVELFGIFLWVQVSVAVWETVASVVTKVDIETSCCHSEGWWLWRITWNPWVRCIHQTMLEEHSGLMHSSLNLSILNLENA